MMPVFLRKPKICDQWYNSGMHHQIKRIQKIKITTIKKEIENYIHDHKEATNTDIFQYWKDVGQK